MFPGQKALHIVTDTDDLKRFKHSLWYFTDLITKVVVHAGKNAVHIFVYSVAGDLKI